MCAGTGTSQRPQVSAAAKTNTPKSYGDDIICPHMLPLWVMQTPPETNVQVNTQTWQWRIYPTCVQPFNCMTMKRVSLVQNSGNIATHLLVHFFFFLNVHKLAGARRCHCHQNSQPGWPLSISKAGVSPQPGRCLIARAARVISDANSFQKRHKPYAKWGPGS